MLPDTTIVGGGKVRCYVVCGNLGFWKFPVCFETGVQQSKSVVDTRKTRTHDVVLVAGCRQVQPLQLLGEDYSG